MKTNTTIKSEPISTHEGGHAVRQPAEVELRRAVSTCLLWEDTFYEKGSAVAARIADLCTKVKPEVVASLAREARTDLKLRHVPLYLALQLIKCHSPLTRGVITDVVQRPDEMGELLSLYWKEGRRPLAAQLKRGLAQAFTKFSAYNLAKWNKDATIKLRDVMFMVHPKPIDAEQAATWKKLVEDTLESPDTWEVALSTGKDKKATWERLLSEGKLGDMALLMNLRNMSQVGVNSVLIKERLVQWSSKSVALPFRFIAAAQAAPDFEDALGLAMVQSLSSQAKLQGRTLFVIDVSGSMNGTLSTKSMMTRIDAACGLAMLIREVCEEPVIYATAGNDYAQTHATEKAPPRHAFALRDAIQAKYNKLGGGGIFCHQALTCIQKAETKPFDRIVLITDEQDCDSNKARKMSNAPLKGTYNYLLNVASYKPGLDVSGGWIRINGWSERVIDWVRHNEGGEQ